LSAIPTLNLTSAGAIPSSPDTLQQALIAGVAAVQPGYTANLPGTLIEDISSTDVGALITQDQSRVDAVNNLSPVTANPFILTKQGQMMGIPQGTPSNTNAYVVFSGPVGYIIPSGFVVTDGTYQYAVQQAIAIGSSGSSAPCFVVANQSGSWAVIADSINTISTSVPTGYTITVTNPEAGTPGTTSESVQSYRSRVLLANQVTAQGVPDFIKTLLLKIPGVTSRLISIPQVTGGWEVICGGGDPYAVALAIYSATLDLSTIIGSTTTARNISAAIISPPNTYTITFVNPPAQTVTGTITWNTTATNFTAGSQVNQLAQTAVGQYINSIPVGSPINLLQLGDAFQESISNVLPAVLLTTLTFALSINGVAVSPTAGTQIIPSDPESYFSAALNGVTVVQG